MMESSSSEEDVSDTTSESDEQIERRRKDIVRLAAEMLEEIMEYRILSVLGQGTYGDVLKLYDPHMDVNIAAKIVTSDNSSDSESMIWPDLKHPNIVPLLEQIKLSSIDATIFMMPVQPNSLHDIMNHKRFLEHPKSLIFVKKWLYETLTALEYLNSLKLCHLDIKVDNVLVSDVSVAMLCDFSFLNTTTQYLERYDLGLPYIYRPPEACQSLGSDIAIDGISYDMWGYGLMVVEILSHFVIANTIKDCKLWFKEVYPTLFEILQEEKFKYLMMHTFPGSGIKKVETKVALNFIHSFLISEAQNRSLPTEAKTHQFLNKGTSLSHSPDPMWIDAPTGDSSSGPFETHKANIQHECKHGQNVDHPMDSTESDSETSDEYLSMNESDDETKCINDNNSHLITAIESPKESRSADDDIPENPNHSFESNMNFEEVHNSDLSQKNVDEQMDSADNTVEDKTGVVADDIQEMNKSNLFSRRNLKNHRDSLERKSDFVSHAGQICIRNSNKNLNANSYVAVDLITDIITTPNELSQIKILPENVFALKEMPTIKGVKFYKPIDVITEKKTTKFNVFRETTQLQKYVNSSNNNDILFEKEEKDISRGAVTKKYINKTCSSGNNNRPPNLISRVENGQKTLVSGGIVSFPQTPYYSEIDHVSITKSVSEEFNVTVNTEADRATGDSFNSAVDDPDKNLDHMFSAPLLSNQNGKNEIREIPILSNDVANEMMSLKRKLNRMNVMFEELQKTLVCESCADGDEDMALDTQNSNFTEGFSTVAEQNPYINSNISATENNVDREIPSQDPFSKDHDFPQMLDSSSENRKKSMYTCLEKSHNTQDLNLMIEDDYHMVTSPACSQSNSAVSDDNYQKSKRAKTSKPPKLVSRLLRQGCLQFERIVRHWPYKIMK